MSSIIERDWTTNAGLRAVCLVVLHHGTEAKSHRCGYVCLPKGHPLHGMHYGQESPALKAALERLLHTPQAEVEHMMSFGRMIGMLCGKAEPRADFVLSVHGGITYSSSNPGDGYPVQTEDGWWYGFDCNHCDDGYIEQNPRWPDMLRRTQPAASQSYVVSECESLAEQLANVASECQSV